MKKRLPLFASCLALAATPARAALAQTVHWLADPVSIYAGAAPAPGGDPRHDPRLAFNNAVVCGHGADGRLWLTYANNNLDAAGHAALYVDTYSAGGWTHTRIPPGDSTSYESSAIAVSAQRRQHIVHGWIARTSGHEPWRVLLRGTDDSGVTWSTPRTIFRSHPGLANLTLSAWTSAGSTRIGVCWQTAAAAGAVQCSALQLNNLLDDTVASTPVTAPACTEHPSVAGFGDRVLVACDDHAVAGATSRVYVYAAALSTPAGIVLAHQHDELGNDAALGFDLDGNATLAFQVQATRPSGLVYGQIHPRQLASGGSTWGRPWGDWVSEGWFAHVAPGLPGGYALLSWEQTPIDYQSDHAKYFGLYYGNSAAAVVFDRSAQGGTEATLTQYAIAPSVCSDGSVVDRFWVNVTDARLFHQRGTFVP